MRDQAPPKLIQGALARLRVLADDKMLLSGCPVVAAWSVNRVDKGDHFEPKLVRRGRLSDATTHGL